MKTWNCFDNKKDTPNGNERAFRLVCLDRDKTLVERFLQTQGFAFREEPFSPYCCTLEKEPFPLGSSLAAVFGYIYIQDRSSMLPPLYLAPARGDTVLDMCASPGGKTGFLAQLVGESGLVVANESNNQRLGTLRQNLRRMNLIQVVTTGYAGQKLPLDEESFSHILLDAPCSGWGTVQKNPRIKEMWTKEKTGSLAGLQKKLLASAARLLMPGGELVYSTCTTNEQENEEQILWAAKEFGLLPVDLEVMEGVEYGKPHKECPGCIRIQTGRSQQGFFIAKLTKPGQREKTMFSGEGPKIPDRGEAFDPNREPDLDWSLLPPGKVAVFNRNIYFLPQKALALLKPSMPWQGFKIGKMHQNNVRIDPRLRRLIPRARGSRSRVSSVGEIESLLSGRSLPLQCVDGKAGWYWDELPLGWLTCKSNRLLWTDR